MNLINRKMLEQIIEASAEPMMVVRLDRTDWPVVLVNPAFESISSDAALKKPFADLIEDLLGRESALEISETIRSRQESSFPVEVGGREYLLDLKPLLAADDEELRFYAVFWRGDSGSAATIGSDTHHALLKAKHRIRDLTRDDAVTGLLNGRAFREIFHHDWAVSSREKGTLAVVLLTLDDFDAYVEVFGKHAADTCLRRVGQAVRRCLRRASDVVARLDGAQLVVLSHASDEEGVREFATGIAAAVRELGLHHPRSSSGRYVTVSYRVAIAKADQKASSAAKFLKSLLADRGR